MTDEKYAPQERYDKDNTVRVSLKLNRKTDADIIEWLSWQDAKQTAVKKAIRYYLKKVEKF